MLKDLSEFELGILNLLEENSSIPDKEVAKLLKKSEEDVATTRKALEKEGIILKYKAIVNWEKIESPEVIAIIQVNVTPNQGSGYDEVARKIAQFEEVSTTLLVSGAFDLLVEVSGPSLKDVAYFVADKLSIIDGVEATRTNFLLKRYKQSGDMFMVSGKTHRLPMVI